MNFDRLLEQDKRHHLHPMTNPVAQLAMDPKMVTRAEGVYLYTSENRRIMDLSSGLCNVNVGYGNRRICEVAFETMQQLSYSHGLFGRSNPWTAALSAKLNEMTPQQFQYFFFASTGSDAIESSLKIAFHYWRLRGKPQKRKILSRRGSYHGNTLIAASLTGFDVYHTQFGLPLGNMIHHADSPYWYRDGRDRSPEQFAADMVRRLEQQILEIGAENIAAFVGDPVQTGGLIIPPEGYWQGVRRLCDQYDILLIADEVISGFGKTGRMFGFETFGFEPDMFVMAKGLSSGYFPISSVAVGAKVGEVVQRSDELFAHVFTNCGHPVGAAVALENIAVIEDQQLVDRVRREIGPYFHRRLRRFLELPCVGEVRCCGVMGAIEFDFSKVGRSSEAADLDAFLKKMELAAWNKGLGTRGALFCLPMIITHGQIDEAMDILADSIAEALAHG